MCSQDSGFEFCLGYLPVLPLWASVFSSVKRGWQRSTSKVRGQFIEMPDSKSLLKLERAVPPQRVGNALRLPSPPRSGQGSPHPWAIPRARLSFHIWSFFFPVQIFIHLWHRRKMEFWHKSQNVHRTTLWKNFQPPILWVPSRAETRFCGWSGTWFWSLSSWWNFEVEKLTFRC